jgi:hypothetical protein
MTILFFIFFRVVIGDGFGEDGPELNVMPSKVKRAYPSIKEA